MDIAVYPGLLYIVYQSPVLRLVGTKPGGLFFQLFPLCFVEFGIVDEFADITITQQVHQIVLRTNQFQDVNLAIFPAVGK